MDSERKLAELEVASSSLAGFALQSGVVQREDARLWNGRRGFESFPRSLGFDALGWRKGKRTALRLPRASPIEGSIPSPSIRRAGVVQMADTLSSEGGSCEFESHLPYQT